MLRRLVLLGLLNFTIISCGSKAPQQNSIILILVEGLSFSSVTCIDSDSEEATSAFQVFCDESVRFTHAFTPSVLSQSTLASVLTGKYPHDHGVWHNGQQHLPARIKTLAEIAYENNYQTALFSGGAPIFRKAALNQGFEIFDDNITPTLTRLYRPASEVVSQFLEWKLEDVRGAKSVAVLFLGDLQFTDFATTDELGMVRESSYQSQLHEVDVQLLRLINQLKKENAWAESTVVLAGTNGYPVQERLAELKPTNLYAEGTRVTLMIKPPRKSHETPRSRKYDPNVSLVDVGATIFDILGSPPEAIRPPLQVQSLLPILKAPSGTNAINEGRWILSSSAWCGQQGLHCGTRVALREGPLFFLFDQHRKLYNTLTDNLETSPISSDDSRFAKTAEFETYARERGLQAWSGVERKFSSKIEVGKKIWNIRGASKEALRQLRDLSAKNPDDQQMKGWRAIHAIRNSSWAELKTIAPQSKPDWVYVAEVNSNEKSKIRPSRCLDHGIRILRRENRPVPRDCTDDELLRLYELFAEVGDDVDRQRAFENFLRLYQARMIDLRVAEQNLVADADWDVTLSKPSEPVIVDLLLALPEARRFRLQLKERLKI